MKKLWHYRRLNYRRRLLEQGYVIDALQEQDLQSGPMTYFFNPSNIPGFVNWVTDNSICRCIRLGQDAVAVGTISNNEKELIVATHPTHERKYLATMLASHLISIAFQNDDLSILTAKAVMGRGGSIIAEQMGFKKCGFHNGQYSYNLSHPRWVIWRILHPSLW